MGRQVSSHPLAPEAVTRLPLELPPYTVLDSSNPGNRAGAVPKRKNCCRKLLTLRAACINFPEFLRPPRMLAAGDG